MDANEKMHQVMVRNIWMRESCRSEGACQNSTGKSGLILSLVLRQFSFSSSCKCNRSRYLIYPERGVRLLVIIVLCLLVACVRGKAPTPTWQRMQVNK